MSRSFRARVRRRGRLRWEIEAAIGAAGWETIMGNEWATKAQLDGVRISVEFRRDVPGNPVDLSISGSSKKVAGPLWAHVERIDDPRNLAAQLGALLDAVSYHRPTSARAFKSCLGGDPHHGWVEPLKLL